MSEARDLFDRASRAASCFNAKEMATINQSIIDFAEKIKHIPLKQQELIELKTGFEKYKNLCAYSYRVLNDVLTGVCGALPVYKEQGILQDDTKMRPVFQSYG